MLPEENKNRCADRLEQLQHKWAPKYLNRGHAMHQFEQGQITRLIEYLRTVENPHNEAFEMPRLHNDFKKFYQQYDVRRNKNFEKTFPELESWYNSL